MRFIIFRFGAPFSRAALELAALRDPRSIRRLASVVDVRFRFRSGGFHGEKIALVNYRGFTPVSKRSAPGAPERNLRL
jgi:hypothetical protein